MDIKFIISTMLPLSLATIMLGFGLGLTVDDFKRVIKYPRSVIFGLICQIVLLPVIAFLICKIFQLSPELSIGVMLLAASPGGIAANLFSHLANGDIALNISLTALNSILAAFTLPLLVNIAFYLFMEKEQSIGLQFQKTFEVFMLILTPVFVGMMLKKKFPNFSQRMLKPVKIFSVAFLVTLIIGAIAKEKEQLLNSIAQIGLAMLAFNLLSLLTGYMLPQFLKIPRREATAIAMEVGIHNTTLSMYVAVGLLNSFTLALPSAAYSIIMFFTASMFSVYLSKKNTLTLSN
ncbi:MAG: bile acid:sodium symporter family protein [Bacteriovoracaceae bacterium]|nr:bile acid:sodium symporter family protein [Bacteriovoracaceae bacterium]